MFLKKMEACIYHVSPHQCRFTNVNRRDPPIRRVYVARYDGVALLVYWSYYTERKWHPDYVDLTNA